LIFMTGALGEDVDFGLITLFSLVPLGVAGFTVAMVSDEKEKVLSLVKLNFASLVAFLLLMGLVLLYA